MRGAETDGTVIIGVDASERSRDAVALGRLLARALRTGAILAHAGVEADASSVVRSAHDLLAGVREVEQRVLPSRSPSRALHELAEARGASVIVVGSTHRGPVGRVMPGSVGEQLLHGACCPVAVAPNGYWGHSDQRLRRIGVAFLDTPEGRGAAEAAGELAQRAGATLVALTVAEPSAVVASGLALGSSGTVAVGIDPDASVEVERRARERARASLDELASRLPDGVSSELHLLDGDPVRALATASETLDLLFCGSRGYGPLRSVVVGGVSGRLTRAAACPVVVVPRGATRLGSAQPVG